MISESADGTAGGIRSAVTYHGTGGSVSQYTKHDLTLFSANSAEEWRNGKEALRSVRGTQTDGVRRLDLDYSLHIIARRWHGDVLPPLIHIRPSPPAQLSTSTANGCDRQQHSYDIKARPQFCHAGKKDQTG